MLPGCSSLLLRHSTRCSESRSDGGVPILRRRAVTLEHGRETPVALSTLAAPLDSPREGQEEVSEERRTCLGGASSPRPLRVPWNQPSKLWGSRCPTDGNDWHHLHAELPGQDERCLRDIFRILGSASDSVVSFECCT